MKLLKFFLVYINNRFIIRAIFVFWSILALVTFFFVDGHLGWWILGIWLVLTAVAKVYYNKLNQPHTLRGKEKSTSSKSQKGVYDLLDNKVFRVIFFYFAQFIPFAVVLEPSEMEWWMHIVWGAISLVCGLFIDKSGFRSPFRRLGC